MSRKTGGFLVALGYCVAALAATGCLLPLISCGGGGGGDSGGGGLEHDYTVRLSPEKTMVAPGGTVNLNLYYDAPASNAGIAWSLGCIQTDCGSVSASGIYTAPAKVDEQIAVGIRAISKDDSTKSHYVTIWVTGKIVVRINANNLVGLHVNQTAHLSATVNSPDEGLIWQVNGVAGGNATVGTISTAGLYTAPAQVPNPDVVNVGAAAHVDSSASATVPVQIWPAIPVNVSISPQNQAVPIGTTLQFTATIENTTDTAVQWQVNGIEGGNSTIGTISAAGLFTAPAALPTPAKETITAVSHADSTKSASTSVTIVGLHNSLLNGYYAFELSGPDASGKMMAMIGSFVADGNGNLHGLMDVNGVAMTAALKAVQFTGSYTIGSQNLGYMFLNLNPQLTLAFTMNEAGNDAKLIEFDTRGTRYVGSMQKQEASLSWAKFAGYYVFSSQGSTMSGERITTIGRFQAVTGGTINNVFMYIKEQGYQLTTLYGQAGMFSMSNNTYGRGDFSLIQSGTTVSPFSYYMINGNELLFLSTDPVPGDNPLFVGRILKQAAGPFSYGSLWKGSVFSAAGVVASDSSKSVLIAGQWQADPNASALSGTEDINEGGQISADQYMYSNYVIDVTGHGTVLNFIFYIVDQNRAILMSGDEQGLVGMAEPQSPPSTFDSSLLNGTYRIGPISTPVPGGSISQGILVADGSGTFWAGENILDQGTSTKVFTGTYSVDSTGRAELTVTSPETHHYALYPVSSTRFVGISLEPKDSNANVIALDK